MAHPRFLSVLRALQALFCIAIYLHVIAVLLLWILPSRKIKSHKFSAARTHKTNTQQTLQVPFTNRLDAHLNDRKTASERSDAKGRKVNLPGAITIYLLRRPL
jgi:hypothetical protein